MASLLRQGFWKAKTKGKTALFPAFSTVSVKSKAGEGPSCQSGTQSEKSRKTHMRRCFEPVEKFRVSVSGSGKSQSNVIHWVRQMSAFKEIIYKYIKK